MHVACFVRKLSSGYVFYQVVKPFLKVLCAEEKTTEARREADNANGPAKPCTLITQQQGKAPFYPAQSGFPGNRGVQARN